MGSGLADLDFFGAVMAIFIWLIIPITIITLIFFLPGLAIRKLFHLNLSKLKLLLFSFLIAITSIVAMIPFLNDILPIVGGWVDKVF